MRAFWSVVLAAALVRALNLGLAAAGSPYFGGFVVDDRAYHEQALRIAAGDWVGDEPFFLSPLLPYVLGSLYAVLGEAPLVWLAIQVVLSAFTAGFVALVAARVYGARAGWVSLLVCAVAFAVIHRDRLLRLPRHTLATALVFAAAVPVLAYFTLDSVEFRIRQSYGELTGQVPTEVSPLSHRGYIWLGAFSMIKAHPINGVGARGFRYAFPQYAAPDDPFVSASPPILPTHSHQLLVELAAETGIFGLAGLLFATVILVRTVRSAPTGATHDMVPYAIALGAAFFPLNTHLALYSAHWSQVVWWLAAATCGCLLAGRSEQATNA